MPEPVHSRLAPSAAHRWTRCPASVRFLEDHKDELPEQNWTYADEGTTAHLYASKALEHWKKGTSFEIHIVTKAPADTQLISEEMDHHVRNYFAFVKERVSEGDRLLVEQRVPLFYYPEQRGTVDVAIIGPKGIYIIDLKYGAGVSVEARENTQLAIYAESLIQEMEMIDDVPDDTLVTLCIYQPRDRNNPEPVRLWALSRAELREFCRPIQLTANAILHWPEPLQFHADPDKQCRFCPAQGICATYAAHVLGVIPQAEVDAGKPIVLPDPASLTREQRCNVIGMIDGLTSWMEAVKAQEMHELMQGAEPVGFKLVEGKSNRQWTDEAAAAKLLGNYLSAEEKFSDPKLISPAQAEKLLKGKETSTKFQNRLAQLISKPEGKPTLALHIARPPSPVC